MPEKIPSEVEAAVAAYLNSNEKVSAICSTFNVGNRRFYSWLKRLEIPKRGRYEEYRKREPDRNVKAAVEAYAKGNIVVADIVKQFGISHRCILYEWINRLGVPKRRWIRKTGKAGQPMKAPFVYECDWCGDPLSFYQVKRRRKYCCAACRRDGTNDLKHGNTKTCTAPGCSAEAMEDTLYCSWPCFQIANAPLF